MSLILCLSWKFDRWAVQLNLYPEHRKMLLIQSKWTRGRRRKIGMTHGEKKRDTIFRVYVFYKLTLLWIKGMVFIQYSGLKVCGPDEKSSFLIFSYIMLNKNYLKCFKENASWKKMQLDKIKEDFTFWLYWVYMFAWMYWLLYKELRRERTGSGIIIWIVI